MERFLRNLLVGVIALATVSLPYLPAAAVEVYFSPSGGAEAAIARALDGARHTIDVAMYAFTSRPLAQALLAARQRGVRVRLILDRSQSDGRYAKADYFEQAGLMPHIVQGLGRGIMHDKFAVIDGRRVLTGSFNWTASAEADNHENLLVIDDSALAGRYEAEFMRMYVGGDLGGGSHGMPSTRRHHRWHWRP